MNTIQETRNAQNQPATVITPLDEARLQIARLSSKPARQSLSTWWMPMTVAGALLMATAVACALLSILP